MENLYTYSEAAERLDLGGRSAVARRLGSLAQRGLALTVEAGELQQIGARRLITEAGLERLRAFEPAQSGAPAHKKRAKASQSATSKADRITKKKEQKETITR